MAMDVALTAIKSCLEAVSRAVLGMGSQNFKSPSAGKYEGFVHVSVPLAAVVEELSQTLAERGDK